MSHSTFHPAGLVVAALALLFLLPDTARAQQSCDALTPSGGDDAPTLNACLANTGRATLGEGVFRLSRPLVFPRAPGVRLSGAGASTVLRPTYTCGQSSPFVLSGQYQPIITVTRAPGAVLRDFRLNLQELRRDCGHKGAYAIMVDKSDDVQVLNLRLRGSQFGAPDYTSGWANGGGLQFTNSARGLIRGNDIRDVGFTADPGTASAGKNGIAIENSASTRIDSNVVERVSFQVSVSNFSPAFGFTGDSSGTSVTGNTLVGAANINCPDCSPGRAIKLQACGRTDVQDELPLRNLVVRNNDARDFGGANGQQGGSGLDLVCGVQYGTFENNRLIGAGTAEFAGQVRSSFQSLVNPSHHNTLNFNTFTSGRGRPGCDGSCVDVNFNVDAPDQIGLRRGVAGTNVANSFRPGSSSCGDYSHAFFNYPAGQVFVNRGQNLLLAAAGMRPGSSTVFRFKRQDGSQVAAFTSQSANGNCVVNEQLFGINAAQFAPGRYNLFAEYSDGSSNGVFISNDPIGTVDVR
ncbi:hypothetical protein [Pyxidicoccus caerfyrddinensis]|uniref:hypothetical protein n=1 Tax=Pyxidicoccus caerfyrddinensis TaxID=2709663 RepID=UPI0013DD5E2C|nr:hypothetical protein [Pyxidicoccus caerfyrddinensis]